MAAAKKGTGTTTTRKRANVNPAPIAKASAKKVAPVVELRAFTVEQVAERLGVSPNSVRRAIARGDLRTVKLHRLVRVPASEMERFLQSVS